MGYKVKMNNQEVEDQIMNNFQSLGFEIVLPKDEEELEKEKDKEEENVKEEE